MLSNPFIVVFSCLNTRIGMPWTYLEHGFWAMIGFVVVCGLIILVLGMLCANMKTPIQPAIIGVFVILIVAGLLLQTLPHTRSGIQFVPLFPWIYTDWLSRIVSGVVWLLVIFSFLNAIGSHEDHWGGAAGELFVALFLNALLSFSGPSDAAQTNGKPSPLRTCEDKIDQWEKRQTEQSEMLDKLLSDKESLVSRIRDLGLNKQDLMAHRVGRPLVEELEQLTCQIAKCQGEVEAREAVLENAKSKLRIFERQRMLHPSTDEDFRQMSEVEHQMEAELHRRTGESEPGSQMHLDKLLDDVILERKSK